MLPRHVKRLHLLRRNVWGAWTNCILKWHIPESETSNQHDFLNFQAQVFKNYSNRQQLQSTIPAPQHSINTTFITRAPTYPLHKWGPRMSQSCFTISHSPAGDKLLQKLWGFWDGKDGTALFVELTYKDKAVEYYPIEKSSKVTQLTYQISIPAPKWLSSKAIFSDLGKFSIKLRHELVHTVSVLRKIKWLLIVERRCHTL